MTAYMKRNVPATEVRRKHTPGPWYADGADEGLGIWSSNNEALICLTRRGMTHEARIMTHDEEDANGDLLAAAPDLLAACEAVLTWAATPGNHGGNPYTHEFVQLADAAIRKAKGEEG